MVLTKVMLVRIMTDPLSFRLAANMFNRSSEGAHEITPTESSHKKGR
jgi:hypothetical protein